MSTLQELFTHKPAEDDQTDPEYVYNPAPHWSIQDARAYGAGLVLIEHAPEGTADADHWVQEHGEFTLLGDAMAECIRKAAA